MSGGVRGRRRKLPPTRSLQEKKRELADQILEGENLNGSSLTREELVELLTGK